MKIRFIPFSKVVYKTSLRKTELIKLLDDNVDQEDALSIKSKSFFDKLKTENNDKFFRGKVDYSTFSIEINSNRSVSIISGEIIEQGANSIININMKFKMFTYFEIFMFFILPIAVFGIKPPSGMNFFDNVDIVLFLCAVFTIAGYINFIIKFNLEINKSVKALQEVFEAEIIE